MMKITAVLASLSLFACTVFAQSVHILSWTAPTQYADGTALTETVTYNVYTYVAPNWVKIGTNVAALSFSLTVPVGTNDYEVTAITVDGRESAMSAMAIITVAKPVPMPPTGLTVK
jgi:hypothetical protein